jgi:uncharacterized membrane protein YqjE
LANVNLYEVKEIDVTQPSGEGLLDSIKTLTSTLVAIAYNRLHLLSADIEVARERLISVVITMMVSLFFLCFGVLLLSIFVVVIFWDTHRIIALGAVTGLFLGVGALLMIRTISAVKKMPATFEASLAELAKDHAQLNVESEDAS